MQYKYKIMNIDIFIICSIIIILFANLLYNNYIIVITNIKFIKQFGFKDTYKFVKSYNHRVLI